MSCSCTSVGNMPNILPVAKAQTIEMKLTPSQSQPEGEFTGVIKLFTDDARDRELVLTFLARLDKTPSEH